MEDEAGVAGEPGQHLRLLVDGVVVEDDVDDLAGRDLCLNGVEEADDLLMPVALHAAPEHGAIEDVEGGEQGGGAVALVVNGSWSRRGPDLIHQLPCGARPDGRMAMHVLSLPLGLGLEASGAGSVGSVN
ncbi:MAG: hypothetical protein K0R61_856 [Microvirga sp.]|nr:hypothetical protein [Geminicoccaceae bacterium]MDF2970406.1 hypothetical protein [Microvirga sp.]